MVCPWLVAYRMGTAFKYRPTSDNLGPGWERTKRKGDSPTPAVFHQGNPALDGIGVMDPPVPQLEQQPLRRGLLCQPIHDGPQSLDGAPKSRVREASFRVAGPLRRVDSPLGVEPAEEAVPVHLVTAVCPVPTVGAHIPRRGSGGSGAELGEAWLAEAHVALAGHVVEAVRGVGAVTATTPAVVRRGRRRLQWVRRDVGQVVDVEDALRADLLAAPGASDHHTALRGRDRATSVVHVPADRLASGAAKPDDTEAA